MIRIFYAKGRDYRLKLIKIICIVLLLTLAIYIAQNNCSPQGIALSANKRAFNSLKNRTALPQESDFDHRVTLAALLEPGDDRQRWSSARAATIEGYVVAIKEGGIESANCFSLTRRDIHVEVALRLDAPPRERVILEVTPPMRDWARNQGSDWSAATLRRELVGRWCQFEGWLLFDVGHVNEAENTAQGREDNWRATAWEIHPVTYIKAVR